MKQAVVEHLCLHWGHLKGAGLKMRLSRYSWRCSVAVRPQCWSRFHCVGHGSQRRPYGPGIVIQISEILTSAHGKIKSLWSKSLEAGDPRGKGKVGEEGEEGVDCDERHISEERFFCGSMKCTDCVREHYASPSSPRGSAGA